MKSWLFRLEKARLQVEQLLPFEVHDIRIRAKNRKGWSDWSGRIQWLIAAHRVSAIATALD